MAKVRKMISKYFWLFLLLNMCKWLCYSAADILTTIESRPCSDVFNVTSLPCICFNNSKNETSINCDGVTFHGDYFPVLPYRQNIHSFSQSSSGLQSLEAQLFTASDIPLESIDFSNNLLRRITERTFDGIEDTLKEINLRNNKLGDQLNSLFSSGEFHRLTRLLKLDLSGNGIKEFQPGIFSGLVNLQELKLESNSIVTVPRMALIGLKSLKSLHLQLNYILDVGVHSFPNLTSLQFLNLSSNDITTIQSMSFAALPNLQTLILSNNKIKTFDQGLLDGLNMLEYLDLSQNLLEDLPLGINSNSSLKRLVLYSNKIRSLSRTAFNDLKSLEFLDLRRNRIFEITANTFIEMKNLKEIHLDINTVRKVKSGMFSGLENLSDLTLSDNRILAFPTESFNVFRKLRKLSLDYNRIAAISREILAPARKNEELSLAFNLISEIPDGTFMEFESLELLNLHGNKISNFSRGKTAGLEHSLLYLDIGYNEITQLPQLHFPNLLILSVARNKISKIETKTLKPLVKLKFLNISYNMLSEFSRDLFIGLKNMEHLDLQHNLLKTIPASAFQNLSVIEMNFKNNQLQDLHGNTFENLYRLKYLDLSLNRIENISEHAFINVPNIETLNLGGNKLTIFRGNEFSVDTKIHTLILSKNRISNLYPQAFYLHSKIKYLDLSFNELNFFPFEAVSYLIFLQRINLEGNKLLSVGEKYFSNMPNLKRIDLQDNQIRDVSELAFQNSSNIKLIFLQNNQISSVLENTFISLSRLELDISNNNLTFLPSNVFSRSKGLKLESINLANNAFREFPNEALKKQYPFLERLNISFNKIRNLPSNADILVNIKELDVSFNPLSPEAQHVLFGEPKSVRKLYVESVGISYLPTIECPFLKLLDLKGNKLSKIDSNVFDRTSMLINLDLSQNAFPNLNINLVPALMKLPYLKSLDMSNNPVQYITKSDFSHFQHMRELKINNLKELVELNCESLNVLPRLSKLQMYGYHSLSQFSIKQCLQNLIGLENLRVEVKDLYLKDQLQSFFSPKLDTLSVSGENLRSVSSSAFAGMLSPVIKIQLSHTSIDTFNDKIFLPLPLSSKIEFSIPHNKIKRLTSEMLAILDNKQVDIAIHGINLNPISCDCHLNFLWNWLHDKTKTSNDQHQEDISLNDFICSEPDRLRGKKLKELAFSDLTCEDSSFTKVTDVSVDSSTSYFPTSLKETTSLRDHPYIIFEQPVTKRPSVPLSYVPAGGNRSALTKVDTMIIGIVAGVVAFVCILIIIICIIRLRRAHPLYTAGPLAGPLAFRAQGKCTCLKPPSSNCTCYPMYSVPYPSGRPSLLQNAQHKMLPPSLPAPPGFLNSGQSGRLRNTPYYVTYPDSDNENK